MASKFAGYRLGSAALWLRRPAPAISPRDCETLARKRGAHARLLILQRRRWRCRCLAAPAFGFAARLPGTAARLLAGSACYAAAPSFLRAHLNYGLCQQAITQSIVESLVPWPRVCSNIGLRCNIVRDVRERRERSRARVPRARLRLTSQPSDYDAEPAPRVAVSSTRCARVATR